MRFPAAARRARWLLALPFSVLLAARSLHASADSAALCERATERAAATTGVPLEVLRTIALAESGRSNGGTRRPWPWAVNFGGQGVWFSGRAEAELAVDERLGLGATNIDIGCFQINHRWHGDAFASLSEMFDPDKNALYAATFLLRLFEETGSWSGASSAFHSRTPELGERYLARLESLSGSDPPAQAAIRRINRFPLLAGGPAGSLGSLVPRVQGAAVLLGATP